MTDKFDFNEALKAIQSGQAISGKDGVLAPLLKQLTEAALEAELDSHLADDVVQFVYHLLSCVGDGDISAHRYGLIGSCSSSFQYSA